MCRLGNRYTASWRWRRAKGERGGEQRRIAASVVEWAGPEEATRPAEQTTGTTGSARRTEQRTAAQPDSRASEQANKTASTGVGRCRSGSRAFEAGLSCCSWTAPDSSTSHGAWQCANFNPHPLLRKKGEKQEAMTWLTFTMQGHLPSRAIHGRGPYTLEGHTGHTPYT